MPISSMFDEMRWHDCIDEYSVTSHVRMRGDARKVKQLARAIVSVVSMRDDAHAILCRLSQHVRMNIYYRQLDIRNYRKCHISMK